MRKLLALLAILTGAALALAIFDDPEVYSLKNYDRR